MKTAWIAGNRDHACELLKYGVLTDLQELSSNPKQKSNLRIYYLLAKFALLSKQDHWVTNMVDAIKSSGAENKFKTAIASWTNPVSRWRKMLKYVH